MRHERVLEAINSPDVKIANFGEAELVDPDASLLLGGKEAGIGQVARLPYGNGFIARCYNGKVVWVDPAGEYWRIERRERFRQVTFPITCEMMD